MMWSGYSIYVIIGFISFGMIIAIMFILLFIAHWNSGHQFKHSLAYFYTIKVSGIVLILVKHILFQPLITVLLATTGCSINNSDGKAIQLGYDCLSDVHIILLSCAMFALVLLIILNFISIVLYADEQPDSQLPWAYCSRTIDIYKLIRKCILAVTMFFNNSYSSVTGVEVFCYIVLTALCLYELYKQTYMNNRKVFYALLTSEGAIAWISVATLLRIMVNTDWSSPIVLGIFVVILLVVVYLMSRQQCESLLLNNSIANLKETEDVETYCRVLLDNVASKVQSSKISLEGIITMHSMSCTKPHCVCKLLCATGEEQGDQGGDGDSPMKKEKEVVVDNTMDLEPKKGKAMETGKGEFGNMGEVELNESNKRKHYLYRLLIDEITVWNDKQEKKSRLHIYLAYLKLFCFENQLAALYELMCARESSPNVYEEFLVYRMM